MIVVTVVSGAVCKTTIYAGGKRWTPYYPVSPGKHPVFTGLESSVAPKISKDST